MRAERDRPARRAFTLVEALVAAALLALLMGLACTALGVDRRTQARDERLWAFQDLARVLARVEEDLFCACPDEEGNLVTRERGGAIAWTRRGAQGRVRVRYEVREGGGGLRLWRNGRALSGIALAAFAPVVLDEGDVVVVQVSLAVRRGDHVRGGRATRAFPMAGIVREPPDSHGTPPTGLLP